MEKKDGGHSCKVCNKLYSSYSSLWNHNKKYHDKKSDNVNIMLNSQVENVKNVKQMLNNRSLTCEICGKVFNTRAAKSIHKKKCYSKSQEPQSTVINENSNNETNNSNNTTTNNQSHNTTNTTANHSHNTTNTNNSHNTNNVTNNITILDYNAAKFEDLTYNEIRHLIKYGRDNVIDIIKLFNFNKRLPQYHSFCSTSLEGKYISVYNPERKRIEKVSKKKFYDKILNNSINNLDMLELFIEMDKSIRDILNKKYLSMLHDRNIDYAKKSTNKKYMKQYKNNINELTYNNNKVVLDTWSTLPKDKKDDEETVYYTTDSDSSVSSKSSSSVEFVRRKKK